MSATGGLAATSATDILIQLLGAVALLLWGTRMVRTGIMRVFGADLRHVLRISLRNRFAAFLAGLGVTGILQSSTATALVVASFVGRGLVETAPALAVMLGADLGSTLVAQVLSLNLHWLAPILILAGVITHNYAERSSYHGLGRVAIGLGLMLLALRLILIASAPMRDAVVLEELFGALAHEALILILIAALLDLARSFEPGDRAADHVADRRRGPAADQRLRLGARGQSRRRHAGADRDLRRQACGAPGRRRQPDLPPDRGRRRRAAHQRGDSLAATARGRPEPRRGQFPHRLQPRPRLWPSSC